MSQVQAPVPPNFLLPLEAGIRARLDDDFCKQVLTGALKITTDQQNPIRINLFSAAMREIFSYVLHLRAPDEEVTACAWFTAKEGVKRPTRKQRAKYATQGGLSDEYVAELGIDVVEFHDQAISAIDELSKYTHVRPGTIVTGPAEIDAFVEGALWALNDLLLSFETCRRTVLNALSDTIDDEAVTALISETIQDVDEIATHHSVDEVIVEGTEVISITHDELCIRATGTLSVGLQWGSDSDVANDMGATLDESFPFVVTMRSSVEDTSTFYDIEYSVDTSDWFGKDDDDDG